VSRPPRRHRDLRRVARVGFAARRPAGRPATAPLAEPGHGAARHPLLQVPANRIGYSALSLGQLKILQEAITLAVFVPFAVLYMRQPLRLDFLWAALCLCGAVYFVFRGT
jgi:Putative member of DMT superfamily (DUF486)